MIAGLRRTCLALALLAIGFTGCSPGLVNVKGKILKNGAPMVVSEDTYVTLSFIVESKETDNSDAKSYSAKFDQKTGTYTVDLPPGNYRTMFVVALPAKKEGQLNAPSKPVKSEKVYEFKKNQELDIEVPGK
jgi:hypothetical protein